jgi:hypothetical protein
MRPVLGFGTARTGIDVEEAVARIILSAEKGTGFHLIHLGENFREGGAELRHERGITRIFRRQLKQGFRIVDLLPKALEFGKRGRDLRFLALDLGGFLGVLPEGRIGFLALDLA